MSGDENSASHVQGMSKPGASPTATRASQQPGSCFAKNRLGGTGATARLNAAPPRSARERARRCSADRSRAQAAEPARRPTHRPSARTRRRTACRRFARPRLGTATPSRRRDAAEPIWPSVRSARSSSASASYSISPGSSSAPAGGAAKEKGSPARWRPEPRRSRARARGSRARRARFGRHIDLPSPARSSAAERSDA